MTAYSYVPPRQIAKGRKGTPGIAKHGKVLVHINRARDPDGPSITSKSMTVQERDKLTRKLVELLNEDAEHPLLEALENLYRAYVATLETGRQRILDLGGSCDSVHIMQNSDPALAAARATITATRGRA